MCIKCLNKGSYLSVPDAISASGGEERACHGQLSARRVVWVAARLVVGW